MNSFLIFIFLFFSQTVFSQWPKNLEEQLNSHYQNYKDLKAPGFVSYIGGIKRYFSNTDIKGEYLKFKSKKLLKKDLEYYFYKNERSKKLTVFFPGIFGSIKTNNTKNMIYRLEKSNSNILAISNFLSPSYLESNPIYTNTSDSFFIDVQIAKEIINKYIKKYSQITFYAESLGSMLSSRLMASFSKEFPQKKFHVSFLWPPINIQHALKNFDLQIKKTSLSYKECSYIMTLVKFLYYEYTASPTKIMNKEYIKCMNAFLFHRVFVKAINKSFQASAFAKSEQELKSFKEYMKITRPQVSKQITKNSKETTLKYWLKRRNHRNTKLYFITSSDDFLNLGISWDSFLNEIKVELENVIILKWGSHSGPLGMPAWDNAFKE